jgi:hypothetical protein
MKIWEAIQMLEQMDQNKEVTVTFGQASKKPFNGFPKYDTVRPQYVPDTGVWPTQPTITCKSTGGGPVH